MAKSQAFVKTVKRSATVNALVLFVYESNGNTDPESAFFYNAGNSFALGEREGKAEMEASYMLAIDTNPLQVWESLIT